MILITFLGDLVPGFGTPHGSYFKPICIFVLLFLLCRAKLSGYYGEVSGLEK